MAFVFSVQAVVILEDHFNVNPDARRDAGHALPSTTADTMAVTKKWFNTNTGGHFFVIEKLEGSFGGCAACNVADFAAAAIPLPQKNLQDTLSAGQSIRLTAVLRPAECQWISAGFWSDSAGVTTAYAGGDLVLLAQANGEWSLYSFTQTDKGKSVLVHGDPASFDPAVFTRFEMEWFKDSNTVNLWINGKEVLGQFDLNAVPVRGGGIGLKLDVDEIGLQAIRIQKPRSAAADEIRVEVLGGTAP
ncbi:MAG: hypothetical protein AB7E95_11470 [Kiritimatiellales bacterium]